MLDVRPADARLVAADPAVPGMRDVLDPIGLVHRLAPAWGVADARVAYLRYKPGTSLVAGLVLTDDDGATSFAQALALDPAVPDKLVKARWAGEDDDVGRGAVVDDHLGVVLADVTADRRLRGVRRVLRSAAGDVTPLVYKPGRRWVARHGGAGAPGTLVKVHQPAALPGLLAGYRALAGLPVTTVDRVHRRHGIISGPWVPGTPLDRLGGPAAAGLWARAGGVLAQVHRQPRAEGLVRVDRADQLAAAVAAVRAVAPDRAAGAREVAGRVRAGLAGTEEPCVVHGDFSADQVIVRPDLTADGERRAELGAPDRVEVTLIDLDRVALDDPLADLASWYGALVATGAEPGDPHDVLAPLLAGYAAAGGEARLERLRLHCAAAVLQRAPEPFRRHLHDWPAHVAHLLAVARELAA